MWKESTKVNEAFDMGFQQYCARIVQFAMPHNVDGTGNCHNQTASHHLSGRMLTGQPRRCTEAHGDGDSMSRQIAMVASALVTALILGPSPEPRRPAQRSAEAAKKLPADAPGETGG
jgi:hypothetical protein